MRSSRGCRGKLPLSLPSRNEITLKRDEAGRLPNNTVVVETVRGIVHAGILTKRVVRGEVKSVAITYWQFFNTDTPTGGSSTWIERYHLPETTDEILVATNLDARLRMQRAQRKVKKMQALVKLTGDAINLANVGVRRTASIAQQSEAPPTDNPTTDSPTD